MTRKKVKVRQNSLAGFFMFVEGLGGFGFHSLSVNGNYKNPSKEDAVQLAVKFGLRKDEAEEMFEEIQYKQKSL